MEYFYTLEYTKYLFGRTIKKRRIIVPFRGTKLTH
jgi:hypothetical protein